MRERNPLFLIHAAIFVFFFGVLSFGQEDLAREETELFKKYQTLNKNSEKGKMHFAREDYKKAKKEFEKILEKLQEHADAHYFLAQVLYREGVRRWTGRPRSLDPSLFSRRTSRRSFPVKAPGLQLSHRHVLF